MESMEELPDSSSISSDAEQSHATVPLSTVGETNTEHNVDDLTEPGEVYVKVETDAPVKLEVIHAYANAESDDVREVADIETPDPNAAVEPLSVDTKLESGIPENDPLISSSDLPSPAREAADSSTITVTLPATMLDSSDFRATMVEYQALNGRMSPGFGSSNYATLTTLQPLPPISTVAPISDKYCHAGNGVSGSFTLMQNNYNNTLSMSMNTYQYDKLSMGMNVGSGLASPNHHSMATMMGNMSGVNIQSNGLSTTQTQNLGSPYSYSQNGVNSPKSPTTYDTTWPTSSTSRDIQRGISSPQSDRMQSPSSMINMNGLPQHPAPTSSPPVITTTHASIIRVEHLSPNSSIASSKNGSGNDVEELNTKEVAARVSAELKRYSIPQAIFAQRVLCRSQGTLSDLLRNPKPWSKLKSGRETFRRMHKWLEEPEFQRMSSLRLAGILLPC